MISSLSLVPSSIFSASSSSFPLILLMVAQTLILPLASMLFSFRNAEALETT